MASAKRDTAALHQRAVTVMTAVIELCRLQKYANWPGSLNVNANDLPNAKKSESHRPEGVGGVPLVTLCWMSSMFVQTTVVPAFTLSACGAN